MKIKALTGFFLFLHILKLAQGKPDTLPRLDLTKIVLASQGTVILHFLPISGTWSPSFSKPMSIPISPTRLPDMQVTNVSLLI
ncbi:hypothetical protein [Salinimicrobium sp. TH3]|uniref:hypothetical protein n=1 Tax=Salinimicrobium sp. TH3 TaxID=2997342 RepID=UPI0022758629|nr:hypothetical protein [Salinimicrobium sp. TH3]MCY2687641.1 hypothetical protein [Salinimicrobium sp. TH3]